MYGAGMLFQYARSESSGDSPAAGIDRRDARPGEQPGAGEGEDEPHRGEHEHTAHERVDGAVSKPAHDEPERQREQDLALHRAPTDEHVLVEVTREHAIAMSPTTTPRSPKSQ
jgi:hypothetical protein